MKGLAQKRIIYRITCQTMSTSKYLISNILKLKRNVLKIESEIEHVRRLIQYELSDLLS